MDKSKGEPVISVKTSASKERVRPTSRDLCKNRCQIDLCVQTWFLALHIVIIMLLSLSGQHQGVNDVAEGKCFCFTFFILSHC